MKNKWLGVILALVAVKSLLWMMLIPPFQSPDENIHFGMIQYFGENNNPPYKRNPAVNSDELIAVTKILNFPWQSVHPVWRGLSNDWRQQILDLPPGLKNEFHYQQGTDGGQKLPQGYYWLNFPVYKIFSGADFLVRFYALRLVSVLLGLGTVYLAYLAGGLTVAALVGFQPMASVIFSSITYDSLAIFITSLFVYLGLNKKAWWALLVAVVGFTVKGQLIALILVWPLLLSGKERWLILPAIGVTGFAARSYWQWIGGINWSSLALGGYLKTNLLKFWAEIFPWYWGVFGWLEKTMPLWVYRGLKIITAAALIGLIRIKWTRQLAWLVGVIGSVALVVFANDWLVYSRGGGGFGVQGRYFLPAIVPEMILLAAGLRRFITPKILIIGAIGLNLVGLFTAYQYFGWVWGS
ncbi:hypothetical protein A3E73_02465 [Candidatus Beckwithbacteria bacterium RIFCSPHIGHO2_12_FULL_47_17]|uniref:Glycosyltransferase RgtA/B/C/D-like domain-containing protein n=1 Tax=Candidatus Beckwithbacteria bacterium RIFCSPHIGHO2_12_FULL_47_17 TaxID=1797460 RepID=A0A1F5DLR5_9BACT|nr:MAG: hypothetical protein A3E73_02465 [Candidatus Beckwithbacteria bacterium RIFCSPHIGHO2_12_FULL_47_17]